MADDLLRVVTALSHAFGTDDYVLGGGGNTSCKDDDTLWVKPSGTTLLGMTPSAFVAISRARLAEIYRVRPPAAPTAREAMVKDMAMAAVLPDSTGRPSVEAPLHDSFQATYVVHTHPYWVNGLTCARGGEAACRRLFPEALWVPYTDPGYTLCMRVREEMADYARARGAQPSVLIMQNHGVFVAAADAEGVHQAYAHLKRVLEQAYIDAGLQPDARPAVSGREEPAPAALEATRELAARVCGDAGACVLGGPALELQPGPLSPDHIVYMRSFALAGEVDERALRDFRQRHGYWPRVLLTPGGGFALGPSPKRARLALEFARDAARVQYLARAFGGVRFLDERARDFIENWEVESYRSKVVE